MLPATGSTMTQAISSPMLLEGGFHRVASLYGRVSVSAASAAGTPGEVGTPRVSAPEPAFTSSESPWP